MGNLWKWWQTPVCNSAILNIRIWESVVGLPISVITVTICDAERGELGKWMRLSFKNQRLAFVCATYLRNSCVSDISERAWKFAAREERRDAEEEGSSPRSIYWNSNVTPWFSGHFSAFGFVFFVLKSLLEIARQWSGEKFAILVLKPPCHVRIS